MPAMARGAKVAKRDREAEGFGDELERRELVVGKVGRLRTLEDPIDVSRRAAHEARGRGPAKSSRPTGRTATPALQRLTVPIREKTGEAPAGHHVASHG